MTPKDRHEHAAWLLEQACASVHIAHERVAQAAKLLEPADLAEPPLAQLLTGKTTEAELRAAADHLRRLAA